MPQRFHFDLVNGSKIIRDEVGVDAVSPEQAVEEAQAVISDMRERGDLVDDEGSWTMVVRDATGAVVRNLPII